MFRKLLIILTFALIFTSVFKANTQTFLENDKIPKDLVITINLGSEAESATRYLYKIFSNGKVLYENHSTSNMPRGRSFEPLLTLHPSGKQQKKPNAPKLKKHLSKKQIKKIIAEIEKSGFYEMNDSYYGDSTLTEINCTTHQKTKSISITANGKTKSVGFYLGCTYGENSPLKKFLILFDKISTELKGVEKKIIKQTKSKS